MSKQDEMLSNDDVKFPICPFNCYFEGDEDKCDISKCDYDIDIRRCTEACKILETTIVLGHEIPIIGAMGEDGKVTFFKKDKNMKTGSMPLKEFDEFLDTELSAIRGILASKSDDYSTDTDKLANFKLQARIDGITPIEALRGNWLKHRASIIQGLNELEQGKVRSLNWWQEKLRDDRNYNLLLHALIQVTYFGENKS